MLNYCDHDGMIVPTDMHRIFQRDLCKLRLATARSFVKVITDGQGPLSTTGSTSLRLDAKVSLSYHCFSSNEYNK
jgi:hypothetical protein